MLAALVSAAATAGRQMALPVRRHYTSLRGVSLALWVKFSTVFADNLSLQPTGPSLPSPSPGRVQCESNPNVGTHAIADRT